MDELKKLLGGIAKLEDGRMIALRDLEYSYGGRKRHVPEGESIGEVPAVVEGEGGLPLEGKLRWILVHEGRLVDNKGKRRRRRGRVASGKPTVADLCSKEWWTDNFSGAIRRNEHEAILEALGEFGEGEEDHWEAEQLREEINKLLNLDDETVLGKKQAIRSLVESSSPAVDDEPAGG